MLYRAVLFTFAPTALELVLVVGLLAAAFSPITAGLVAATFVLYVTWTLALTQVAARRGGGGRSSLGEGVPGEGKGGHLSPLA